MEAELTKGSESETLEMPKVCLAILGRSPPANGLSEGIYPCPALHQPRFLPHARQRPGSTDRKTFRRNGAVKHTLLSSLDRVFRAGQPESHAGTGGGEAHPFSVSFAFWPILAGDGRS